MTPAEESYAAAWLSEMWRPVREYVAPIDPRQQPAEKPVEKPSKEHRNAA